MRWLLVLICRPTSRSLRFSKRFFWFSESPVESKSIHSFASEKNNHATAAWATQTGKGLLFFAKRSEDKAHPAGILNLADATDITKEGTNVFFFKINGHKHAFEASTTEERAAWLVAVETQSSEGKGLKESVTTGEGYKSELEKFSKL